MKFTQKVLILWMQTFCPQSFLVKTLHTKPPAFRLREVRVSKQEEKMSLTAAFYGRFKVQLH